MSAVPKTKELIKLEHQCKMQYAEYIRETERMKHGWEKERMRFKSEEIRKSQEKKQYYEDCMRGRR